MIGFALCHGWSFDRQCLLPLQSLLSRQFPSSELVAFDMGFTGAAHVPVLSPDRKWIAVGHSYGFCYLMQQDVHWHAAISLNGFTRFCRHRREQAGTPVRAVDAMLAGMAENPRDVVTRFHERCGVAGMATGALDVPALHRHLTQLRDVDMVPPACDTLALFTSEDPIVSPPLSRACFPSPKCATQELSGNHMSLLLEPEAGLPYIVQFIENIHG